MRLWQLKKLPQKSNFFQTFNFCCSIFVLLASYRICKIWLFCQFVIASNSCELFLVKMAVKSSPGELLDLNSWFVKALNDKAALLMVMSKKRGELWVPFHNNNNTRFTCHSMKWLKMVQNFHGLCEVTFSFKFWRNNDVFDQIKQRIHT